MSFEVAAAWAKYFAKVGTEKESTIKTRSMWPVIVIHFGEVSSCRLQRREGFVNENNIYRESKNGIEYTILRRLSE